MEQYQLIAGILIVLVFWAFQNGFVNSLGTYGWFVGVLAFVFLSWLTGKSVMSKPSAEMKEMWMFTCIFALVLTAVASFVPFSVLGVVMPAGATAAAFTPILYAMILALFGGAMFVTGWVEKWNVTMIVGLFWLFNTVLEFGAGGNAYLHFGLITGLPFIIYGLMMKK